MKNWMVDSDSERLRDEFAMAALSGLSWVIHHGGNQMLSAIDCYNMADAMLAEKQKRERPK